MQDDDIEPCKYQKDKLRGKKLQKAIMEYNDWLCKFNEIWKNKRSQLAKDIKIHCRQIKNKNKEKGWLHIKKIHSMSECCLFPNDSNQSDTCI